MLGSRISRRFRYCGYVWIYNLWIGGQSVDSQICSVVLKKTGKTHSVGVFADETLEGIPTPKGCDLLVQVRATAANPMDCRVRRGVTRGPESGILGFDAAGVVVGVGPSTRLFKVGDKVYYAGQLDRSGSNTNLQLVDERLVGTMARSLTFAEAASMPLASLSAWEGLFEKLRLHSGSTGTLLVLGAAGGVGSMVTQLARARTDVKVIASASRSESQRWVRELGAHAVVNHSSVDFEEEIRHAAPEGVDYVFSTHSAGILPLLAKIMNPLGQIVAIDSAPGDDFQLLKPKGLSWHWENVFARALHGARDLTNQHEALETIAKLVDKHQVRPILKQVLSPVNAATVKEAHRRVELGHTVGKIVLVRDDVPESNLFPRTFTPG